MENSIYEVSYLFLPSLSAERVLSATTDLKETVISHGGVVISDESPMLIELAYPMTKVVGTTRHKCDSGYFGWTKFEIPKEGILTIKKLLDANDEMLRYLVIKTVRENTLINGKMKFKSEERVKNSPTVLDLEDEVIIDVPTAEKDVILEELDKSIDDLVIT